MLALQKKQLSLLGKLFRLILVGSFINWNKIKCTSVKRNFYFKIKRSVDFEIKISGEIVHFILFVVLIF